MLYSSSVPLERQISRSIQWANCPSPVYWAVYLYIMVKKMWSFLTCSSDTSNNACIQYQANSKDPGCWELYKDCKNWVWQLQISSKSSWFAMHSCGLACWIPATFEDFFCYNLPEYLHNLLLLIGLVAPFHPAKWEFMTCESISLLLYACTQISMIFEYETSHGARSAEKKWSTHQS